MAAPFMFRHVHVKASFAQSAGGGMEESFPLPLWFLVNSHLTSARKTRLAAPVDAHTESGRSGLSRMFLTSFILMPIY